MSPRSSARMLRQPGSPGFTLLEVLVAIAILATVLTAIYGVFTSVVTAKNRLESDSGTFHVARVVYDRLGRELRGVAAQGAPGNKGVFRGGRDDNGSPYLELTTTAVANRGHDYTGIVLVRYSLDRDRESPQGGKVLLRREQSGVRLETAAGSAPMRLAPGMERMAFRYYGNGVWQDEWNAATQGLPAIVELVLEITDSRGNRRQFTSMFDLPNVAWSN